MNEVIVGIDLGTTNSLVACCDERGPRIIESPEGKRILPSVVHINPVTGARTIGDEPRKRAVERPRETIHSIKRLLGRGLRDIEPERAFLPYELTPMSDAGDVVGVAIGDRRFTPQQISAMILAELKRWAENHFGHEVRKAVVTVPAYFDDAQRQATKDAGAIAGLDIVRIVNEPTAAALAYGLDRVREGTVAIYDLGGGTFDISILEIRDGVFSVLATNGDTHLGGDDFDRAIISLVQSEIREQFGQDIDFDPATQQALRAFAEAVKIQLSENPSASIEIDLGNGRTYTRQITRDEFLAMIEPLIVRTLQRCEICLRDSKRERKDIDRVVMVGGSTYMPAIRERVGRFFEAEVYTALNPMEVVALGASVQASILAGVNRELLLRDIVPLSLGIETMGGAVAKIITKGSSIPCRAQELFSTAAEGQTNVKIHVLQGERELVADCRSLGTVILSNIPPMPAGMPKIRVSFFVDANGILLVKAIEERSNTQASIQVVPSYGLSRDEVDRMIRESVVHARADMEAHRLIDLRNQIAIDVAAIEKSMRIVGDELDRGYREELVALIRQLQELSKSDDANRIHDALRALDAKSARLGELAIAKTLREST